MKDINESLGIEFLEIENGVGRAKLPLRPESFNRIGTVSGGILMTLADAISGRTVVATTGKPATTLSSNTDFLNPCFGGDYIWAEARVIKAGKSVSTIECKVYNDQDKILTFTSSNFFTIDKDIIRK